MFSFRAEAEHGPRPSSHRRCQDCGRPATYAPPHAHRRRKHPVVADDSHDLCRRCWRKRLSEAERGQEAA